MPDVSGRKTAREEEEEAADEELADQELLLQDLYGHEYTDISEFTATLGCKRPETFEERVACAAELCKGVEDVQLTESNSAEIIKKVLSGLYCLDFTQRQLSARTQAETRQVFERVAKALLVVSVAHCKLGKAVNAVHAAYLGLESARQLPYQESRSLRIELRIQSALAKGCQRDFAGAAEDAHHVLQLFPGHEVATGVLRNAKSALRREGGPKERRWPSSWPLTRPVPVVENLPPRKPPKPLTFWRKVLLTVAIGPLLAFMALWVTYGKGTDMGTDTPTDLQTDVQRDAL